MIKKSQLARFIFSVRHHSLRASPSSAPPPRAMGRHSKNASAVGKETMTYAERRRMGHGTQTMRLGKHSALPFAYCHLGLAPAASPVCTPEGVTYDKEAIIECLLAQREDNKRRKVRGGRVCRGRARRRGCQRGELRGPAARATWAH